MLCRVPAYSAPIFPSPTIRYFIRYRLGLCRRTARCTGHAHCADGRRSRSDEFQVLECKVAYEDGLADTQFGYVHDQFVGQVLDQRADDQLAGRQSRIVGLLRNFTLRRDKGNYTWQSCQVWILCHLSYASDNYKTILSLSSTIFRTFAKFEFAFYV